ncbi:MAG TPA: arginine--tRNA ligase [Polyangiaceae bacterium]
MSVVERVRGAISAKLQKLAAEGALGEHGAEVLAKASAWTVERPKRPEHGDLATNVAMVLTKGVGKPPRAIAEALVKALEGDAVVRAAEIAGPGFVNLRLHASVFHDELEAIVRAGTYYGRPPAGSGERIDLEFVSANPIGPITIAATRNALFGDAVARLLEATGHLVSREYYINDYGNQVRLFAESVVALAEGREVAEDGYKAEYVKELAAFLKEKHADMIAGDRGALSRLCMAYMMFGIPGSSTLPGIRPSLAALGVHHDVWFSEESLHRWGRVEMALEKLERAGYLQKKEGAVFFVGKGAASDDKDRVVKKSDGDYTYFASDIAYHADKVGRGYDRLITVLGVDHHGYVARVRNAIEALGMPSERFEGLLYNLVYIYRDGEVVKSSKRAGNVLTPDEICEEIDAAAGHAGAGRDALRFFFLSRTANVNVEFDIELAKKKSLDNPVFYVQYGHARLCSILKKAKELGYEPSAFGQGDWSSLTHPDELALASKLGEFPLILAQAAEAREPHKLTFYVQDLARDFQSYFTRLKNDADPVLPPASVRANEGWEKSWDATKTRARLRWIEAVRTVYAAALHLLGVSAPERMDRPPAEEEAAVVDEV